MQRPRVRPTPPRVACVWDVDATRRTRTLTLTPLVPVEPTTAAARAASALAACLPLVFAALPLDDLLRCGAVCHSWCAAALDLAHWCVLRVPRAAAARLAAADVARLLATATRVGARVQTLDLRGCVALDDGALTTLFEGAAVALCGLQRLSVQDCTALTGAGLLAALSGATALRSLRCDGVRVSTEQRALLLQRLAAAPPREARDEAWPPGVDVVPCAACPMAAAPEINNLGCMKWRTTCTAPLAVGCRHCMRRFCGTEREALCESCADAALERGAVILCGGACGGLIDISWHDSDISRSCSMEDDCVSKAGLWQEGARQFGASCARAMFTHVCRSYPGAAGVCTPCLREYFKRCSNCHQRSGFCCYECPGWQGDCHRCGARSLCRRCFEGHMYYLFGGYDCSTCIAAAARGPPQACRMRARCDGGNNCPIEEVRASACVEVRFTCGPGDPRLPGRNLGSCGRCDATVCTACGAECFWCGEVRCSECAAAEEGDDTKRCCVYGDLPL